MKQTKPPLKRINENRTDGIFLLDEKYKLIGGHYDQYFGSYFSRFINDFFRFNTHPVVGTIGTKYLCS